MNRLFALSSLLCLLLFSAPPAMGQRKQRKGSSATTTASGSATGIDLAASPVFSKCFTGFALYDPDKGRMLYEYNADKYFTPASNTKILTLYTSLRLLGDSIPALQYQPQGDLLVFWGTGDPSFLNPHLSPDTRLFDFLRNRKETLLFCPANFKDQRYGDGWMWSDFPYDYQAEKASFPIYSNIGHFRLSDADSHQVEVSPRLLGSLLRYDSLPALEDFVSREEYNNQFIVNTMARRGADREWHVPFRYSPDFFAGLLSDTLHRPVSVLHADLLPPPDAPVVYSIPSDSLYRQLMHVSDNFIAEQLLLLCSWKLTGLLNTRTTIDHARDSLLQALPDEPKWADGSGLSRYNLFTPRSMVAVLDSIRQILPQERLFRLFPAGGQSGTIKNLYRNGGAPYVYAKTGTLRNNHCLSGYLLTKKGNLLIFSFMNNNFTSSTSTIKREMEKILRRIYEQY
ncbi:MAG: D-alanyl-D-alanine carboxypeptidase/D-alanyl-D-alanine endopeptidase [Bacteroidota bacterium]|jgi:D-alanyl-D-alanine carboxypeptidase/D-alanyl-D-alanine-endopeptidase (penicillin-binding protein 4)